MKHDEQHVMFFFFFFDSLLTFNRKARHRRSVKNDRLRTDNGESSTGVREINKNKTRLVYFSELSGSRETEREEKREGG